ncbi:MAG: PAS domain S-box protein, partial [Halobacteriales archaeon]
ITYASGSADRVLGYDPEDLLGESLFDHVHPDDREPTMETFFGTIRDGTGRAGIECRIESGDGEWLTVDARLRNELDDDAIDGMLLYLRDVTESKRRARRFESIFNQTFQFTGLLDPDGTVIEANDAALEFGGFDREDVIGEFFYDIPWWTHSEEVRESVRDALERAADGEFVRYETKVQGASGMGTIDFSAKPVTDEYGEITLLIVEGRDITAQQERRRQMGMMQRVMRHNMRNDLSEIRGYAGLLHEETDPDKQAEYFGIIEEVLDRWESVAEKMRVIRKLLQTPPTQGSGREATGLLEDAISEAKNDVPDASIESDVSVDDTVMVSSELEEAVQELIVNAGQASDRNDPRVEVRASGSGEDGIEITVSDDGPGMPDVEVEVLESGDTTALSHGEGLGLWLVRTVVDRAGGDVSVESSSEGTTVVLRIPERRSVGGDDRPARSE